MHPEQPDSDLADYPVISEETKKMIQSLQPKVTKEFLTTHIFDYLVKAKKTSLNLKCSPKAMAFLSEAKECKNISEGKLTLEIATCKITCIIDFELTDFNFEEQI